jgi:hypothetical protein
VIGESGAGGRYTGASVSVEGVDVAKSDTGECLEGHLY